MISLARGKGEGLDESRQSRGLSTTDRRSFLKSLLAGSTLFSHIQGMQSALLGFYARGNPVFSATGAGKASIGRITPNSDFFIRNHFRAPQIGSESWSLELTGLIGQARKFSYSDLLLMNSMRQTVTMECAGNISGGPGVGNAAWSGVPLGELLDRSGVKSSATGVIFHGADASDGVDAPVGTHFARCIPLEKAMAPGTVLAYEMNGSPLPVEHGFPLRAIVPGWYGMDSVKWLTRIEVTDQPFDGYFQKKFYSALDAKGSQRPVTRMLVNSKFLRPSEGEEILTKSYRIEGVAWAGEGKVVKVELRTGPEEPWQAASIADATEPMTWLSWSYEWHVPRPGRYTLDVRATDDSGHRQPDVRDPGRRDAYELNTPHRIAVTVRS